MAKKSIVISEQEHGGVFVIITNACEIDEQGNRTTTETKIESNIPKEKIIEIVTNFLTY